MTEFDSVPILPLDCSPEEGADLMKILVVEDDREIAKLVQGGLVNAGYRVDIASDAAVGLALMTQKDLRVEPYAAAVIDIMLPGGVDGLSMIERLRAQLINVPVLILSAKRTVDDRIAGLQVGGDDYLTKPFAFAELLARLQALLRRTSRTAETHLSDGQLTLDLISRQLRKGEQVIDLQPKEFTLLEFLMRRPNQVVTKSQILKHVWDYSFDPQTNVVDVLVCRLRNKVQDEFKTRIIETIRGSGYVLKAT